MKPTSLTDEERAIVERQPADGAALLAEFPHLAEAAKIVRAHHERPDGTGYRDGLTATDIPAGASIFSVVDAWDAMVSDRPYREGMPAERAEAILSQGGGTQWCDAAVQPVLTKIQIGGEAQPGRLDRVGEMALAMAGELRIDRCRRACPGQLRCPRRVRSAHRIAAAAGSRSSRGSRLR